MSRRVKIYMLIVFLAAVAVYLLANTQPKKINWFPSYVKNHKIPMGTYVFNEEIRSIIDEELIFDSHRPVFEQLVQNEIEGTLVFINHEIFFNATDRPLLLDWVANGNDLFISAGRMDIEILDTLNLGMDYFDLSLIRTDTLGVKMVNNSLDSTRTYLYDRDVVNQHFYQIDTLESQVLGVADMTKASDSSSGIHVNFIHQQFGDGNIYLHTFPQAFTNYFMLKKQNSNYTAALISYLDTERPVHLDQYYKTGKERYSSPLYVFLKNKALKWAYYLFLIGLLLFVFFMGKRQQRKIPVIEPLKNQTLAFTSAIASLYYENQNYQGIVKLKIKYFHNYLRSKLLLNYSNKPTDQELKIIALRSGNSFKETKKLFDKLGSFNVRNYISEQELITLNRMINRFKKQA